MKRAFLVTIKILGLVTIIMSGLITIIGSGGGGGSSSTAPKPPYTGITTQALITEDNAMAFAVGTWNSSGTGISIDILGAIQAEQKFQQKSFSLGLMPEIFEDIIHNIDIKSLTKGIYIGVAQPVGEFISGSCNEGENFIIDGGATLEGSGDDETGAFTATVSFDDYCEVEQGETIIINGQTKVSGTIDLSTIENEVPELFNYKFTFSSLTLEYYETGDSITINGTFSADYNAEPMLVTMSYVMKNNLSTKAYWFKDVQMELEGAVDFVDINAVRGRYYDPDYGFVEISIGETIRIYDMEDWPSSGSFILRGIDGTKVLLTFLENAIFRVEADTNGDDEYDYIDEFTWSDGIALSTPIILSENRDYSDFFEISGSYRMRTIVRSDSPDGAIYVQNNSMDMNELIPYFPTIDLLYEPYFSYVKTFNPPAFDLPGTAWEEKMYTFFADENDNSLLDTDETFMQCFVPLGAIWQMDIPVVSVTGEDNPTISWQPVENAEGYVINFYELTAPNQFGNLVFTINIKDDGAESYSYTYDGELFNQYDMLAIGVVARKRFSPCVSNRSVYFTVHGIL